MQPQFLVIDDNRDGRSVIVRAAQRKYPVAPTRECASLDEARPFVAALSPDGDGSIVLVGNTRELEGPALVREVRKLHGAVPIIALGRNTDARESLEAGATHFLDYEAWLLLGAIIDRVTAMGKTTRAERSGPPAAQGVG